MREKLIELLAQIDACICTLCGEAGALERVTSVIADHLIACGVTFATDNNAGCKWIPVSERLPEPMEWVLCACRAKIVEVLRYDHIMDDWDTTMPNRCYMKGFVTHWMPLPEPPKEKNNG